MAFKYYPATTFLAMAFCDACEEELRFDGICFPVMPPLYKHSCRSCNKEYSLTKIYPNYENHVLKKEVIINRETNEIVFCRELGINKIENENE